MGKSTIREKREKILIFVNTQCHVVSTNLYARNLNKNENLVIRNTTKKIIFYLFFLNFLHIFPYNDDFLSTLQRKEVKYRNSPRKLEKRSR